VARGWERGPPLGTETGDGGKKRVRSPLKGGGTKLKCGNKARLKDVAVEIDNEQGTQGRHPPAIKEIRSTEEPGCTLENHSRSFLIGTPHDIEKARDPNFGFFLKSTSFGPKGGKRRNGDLEERRNAAGKTGGSSWATVELNMKGRAVPRNFESGLFDCEKPRWWIRFGGVGSGEGSANHSHASEKRSATKKKKERKIQKPTDPLLLEVGGRT